MAEQLYASRVLIAAAGLYAAPTPSVTLAGGGANVKITSTAHGLTSGNTVAVSGTTGVTGLNANWQVQVIDANNFYLVGSSALTGSPAGTTAVALPDLDISGAAFQSEWYVRVKAYGTGLVVLEDTVNAWSATQQRFFLNSQDNAEGVEKVFSWRDWSGSHRFGVGSAKLRARLVSGTNVTISVSVTTSA